MFYEWNNWQQQKNSKQQATATHMQTTNIIKPNQMWLFETKYDISNVFYISSSGRVVQNGATRFFLLLLLVQVDLTTLFFI